MSVLHSFNVDSLQKKFLRDIRALLRNHSVRNTHLEIQVIEGSGLCIAVRTLCKSIHIRYFPLRKKWQFGDVENCPMSMCDFWAESYTLESAMRNFYAVHPEKLNAELTATFSLIPDAA